MTEALRDAASSVALFVPTLALFLLILVVGLLLAKAVGKALSALLTRVGFDRAVERGGVKRALSNSDLDASDVVGKLIFYTLVLLVLQLAFGVFGPNPISDLLTQVITFLPSLIVAIIILVVAAAIAAGVKSLVQGTLGGLSYGRVVANAASVFILFLGVVAALNQVGVATTVTTPVLIAILATVGGVIVVGVGGGLVRPMQQRWEGWLSRAEEEAPRVREEAARAPSVREQAERARDDLSSGQGSPAQSQDTDGSTSTQTVPGYDEPLGDQVGYERPGQDQPGHDQPGYDQPGNGQPGYDRPGYDRPGYDEPAYERPGYDQPGYGDREPRGPRG